MTTKEMLGGMGLSLAGAGGFSLGVLFKDFAPIICLICSIICVFAFIGVCFAGVNEGMEEKEETEK